MSDRFEPPSRSDGPRSFALQSATPEDLLKSQTVGLVHLADFRKRRADVAEQREKAMHDQRYSKVKSTTSGTATPDDSDG